MPDKIIRSARSKIASKVAKFDASDDFHFAKWLRAPRIITPDVRSIYYSEVINDFEVEQLKIPTSLKLKFRLPSEIVVPTIKQKSLIEKPRAYLIFFGLTKPQLFHLKESLLTTNNIISYNSQLPQIPDVIDQSAKFIGTQAEVYNKTDIFSFDQISSVDHSNNFKIESELTQQIDYKIDPAPGLDQEFKLAPKSKIETGSKLHKNVNPDLEPELNFVFSDSSVKDIPLLITHPVVTDELANLIPEIYNIELLNVEQFDSAEIDSTNYTINKLSVPQLTKIDVPGIDNLLNATVTSKFIQFDEIPQAEVIFYTPTFDIAHSVFKVKIDLPKSVVKKVVINQKNLTTFVFDGLNDEQISESQKAEIMSLLSSFRELGWEEYSKSITGLDSYQLESADFLASNNFALLSDELGYEKFNQASSAISFLNKKGNIKSVLLISDRNRFNEYWAASLKSYTKEIKVKKIEPGTTKKIKGNAIWFLDINDIGKIELKDFDKLDLVLFDELVNIKSAAPQIDDIVAKIEPAYIWFLTAIHNDKFNKKFLEEFKFTQQVEFVKSGKSLSEIQDDNPSVFVKNIWLELDEMQLFEYNEALTQAKAELNTLFDSLNPIRFQSNIFTIIHKLKQILNFSSFRNISPKASLLIEQLEAINRNKKKVIVFTQYDVNGMKMLEKVLEMNNVKFVAGRNGMSTEELKDSIDTFYDKREVTVFLTNLKASRLKIKLNKVGYIINFDQWWNPVTLWQNDDDIGISNTVNSPVVVYNYNIRNTFEEELTKLISEKGFNSRYLFDNLKSETLAELITPDDWLYVFSMNDQYKKLLNSERSKIYTKLQSIDIAGYKGLMKYFFSYLGYRDITVMDIDNEQMFYIIGTARKGTTPVNLHGKCLLTTGLKKDDYEEVIHFKPAANEIKKKFVITTGEFDERVTNGTMYIDGKDLANFILTLGLKSQLPKKR